MLLPHRNVQTMFIMSFAAAFAVSNLYADDPPITYRDHIRPIFAARCLGCHNADKSSGGLNLSAYNTTLAGGSGGAILASGDPDASRLFALVSHLEQPNMPPNQPRIPDAELAAIQQWIADGCRDAADSAPAPAKPAVNISLGTVTLGKPAGGDIMPIGLPLADIRHTDRPDTIVALAAHPWSPLVAVGAQQQILIYELTHGELLGVLPLGDRQPRVLQFAHSGRLLLCGGGVGAMSGDVTLWSLETGDLLTAIGEEQDAVRAADIDPAQRRVALGGPARVVKIFDIATGEPRGRIEKHTEWITAVDFSPDGILLATADRNGGAFVWEAESLAPFYALATHPAAITALAWRADGDVLATACEDGKVRLWNMHNGGKVKEFAAHPAGVLDVAFASDGRLATVGREAVIKLWDANGAPIASWSNPQNLVTSVAFDSTGQRVITGDAEGEIRIWQVGSDAAMAMLDADPPALDQQLAQSQAAFEESQQAAHERVVAQQEHAAALATAQAKATELAEVARQAQEAAARAAEARDQLATQSEPLAAQVTQAQQRAQALAARVAKWNAAKLRAQRDRLKSDLAVKRAALAPLKQSVRESDAALTASQQSLAMAQSRGNEITQRQATLEMELVAINSQVGAGDESRQPAADSLAQRRRMRAELAAGVQPLIGGGGAPGADSPALQAAQKAANDMLAAVDAAIAEAQQQLAALDASIAAAAAKRDQLTAEQTELANEAAALPERITQLETAVAAAKRAHDEAVAALDAATEPLSLMEAEIEDVQTRYDALLAEWLMGRDP